MKTKTLNQPPVVRINPILIAVALISLSFFVSGSAMIPNGNMQKDLTARDKRLTILEKLERGERISTEEISSSYLDDPESIEPFICPVVDFKIMVGDIKVEMDMVGEQLGDLYRSQEFSKAMEELKRHTQELKQELEKVRDEMKKIQVEVRGLDTGHLM
jgi:hypothetical protein